MAKYYVVRFKNMADGTESIGTVMAKDSLEDATLKFYKNLVEDMENTNIVGGTMLMLNAHKNVEKKEVWAREPEPIPEEIENTEV